MDTADYSTEVRFQTGNEITIADRPLTVFAINLLYKLADKRLLHWLIRVERDRKNPGKKVYFFKPVDEVEEVIREYSDERRAARGEPPIVKNKVDTTPKMPVTMNQDFGTDEIMDADNGVDEDNSDGYYAGGYDYGDID